MSDEPAFPLHRIVESLLFASQKPISAKELSSIFKGAAEASKDNPSVACYAKIKRDQLEDAIQQLEKEYAETGRSFEVRESAAGSVGADTTAAHGIPEALRTDGALRLRRRRHAPQ